MERETGGGREREREREVGGMKGCGRSTKHRAQTRSERTRGVESYLQLSVEHSTFRPGVNSWRTTILYQSDHDRDHTERENAISVGL